MKLTTVVMLLALCQLGAQTQLPLRHHISRGLDIRYGSQAWLCEAKQFDLLPGKILTDPQGALARRIAQFMELANQNVAKALSGAATIPDSTAVRLEIRLLHFRESSRLRNIPASLGGVAIVDPGEYRLDLAWIDRQSNTEVAIANFELVPSFLAMLIGDSFTRQSAMRRNLRGQMKSLGKYWNAKQGACPASALPPQSVQPIK